MDPRRFIPGAAEYPMTHLEQPDRSREKRRVALSSIAGALVITGLKLVVGLQTNSLGLLSEAAHSGLDLVAAIMTYFAVSISERPPDRHHQYGHGKVENLSAFLETLLLVVTCAWIVWEGMDRLLTGTSHVEATIWSYSVIAISIIVDATRSRALRRVARKYHSQALEADALHFSSDIWSSLVVLIGLVFVSSGVRWVDSVAAIGVALLVLLVSYRLGRRTIDALMDRVPEGLHEDITNAVRRVEGVEEVRSIRLRPSGSSVFVDATVAVRRTTPFHEAHRIMDDIEKTVRELHAEADVIVHAEPFESEDETIADKVRMLVLEQGQGVPHNLEVHHSGGVYHIDFDLEIRKGESFTEAHNIASLIEEKIRGKIPEVGKVTIHIEEYEPGQNEAEGAGGTTSELQEAIRSLVEADPRVLACSDITVLVTGGQYAVSITCSFDRAQTVGEVHAISCELENNLYDRFKLLRRVTVHAEPG